MSEKQHRWEKRDVTVITPRERGLYDVRSLVVVGQATYAYRFGDYRITSEAFHQIAKSKYLRDWWDKAFRCRFEDDPGNFMDVPADKVIDE